MSATSDRLRERIRALTREDPCPEALIVRHSTLEASTSPAAVVLLGPDGRISSMTDGASAWVEELVTEGGPLELPTVITVAASRARRGTRPTRGSMRSSGRWFVVDAAPLEAPTARRRWR
jgi:hypothetical protein